MALDPRYITAVDLCEYFVEKNTGFPMANAKVYFWEDNARTVPKPVYQLTGSPPNYTYTALPNPIILSNTGTFQDSSGNNIAVYYFPYDAFGNVQLYYVQVINSQGTDEFTREAWPNITSGNNPTNSTSAITNQLSNPQFSQVLFSPPTLTLTIAGAGTTTVTIAPDWILTVVATGAASLTVTQNSITGNTLYPFNPPYTLTVTPGGGGANITSITLSQQLPHNPGIWSPQIGGQDGWVVTSVLLAPASSITINYVPSNGTTTTLLTDNNISGSYTQFSNTVQLPPSNNANNSNVGFVNISLILPTATPTTFSNVQVVSAETNVQNIAFEQTPYNRQVDQLFNYYSPLLQYKPIKSYLVGWDFPQNPAQFLSSTVAAQASGANTSNYFWDQTIIFQTTNSGVSAAAGADGSLVLTSAAVGGTQLALVQYLEAKTVNEMLTTDLSCMIKAFTNNAGGLPITISLWYTTGTLPTVSAATYQSIVATLNADGSVATTHAGSQPWVQIARSNIGTGASIAGGPTNANASFTLANSAAYTLNGFQGWLDTSGGSTTATFFAIVIGTGTIAHNSTLTIQSISCVPGKIPTIPEYLSKDETVRQCQRYYYKSFQPNQIPAQNIGTNTGDSGWVNGKVSGGGIMGTSCTIFFNSQMRTIPTITTYNPAFADAQCANYITGGETSATAAYNVNQNSFAVTYLADVGGAIGDHIGVHWTADARLGVV